MKLLFKPSKKNRNKTNSTKNDYPINTIDISTISFSFSARFTTDVIGSVAFGIKCHSLVNPNCEFRKRAQSVFRTNFSAAMKHGVLYAFPELMLSLNIKIIDSEASDFFMNTIKDTVEFREKNDVFRKDFMHLLIQLKNGTKKGDDEMVYDTLSIEEVAAQAFIFFEAGYESSSNTMSFCLFELAWNRHVQEKVRNEIIQILDEHDGILTYDAVEEMKFLDQVLCGE